MEQVKVSNVTSSRSGEAVRNQFVIRYGDKIAFQSYKSLCAVWDGETLTLGIDWDYSNLQSKYGCCNSKAIRKELESNSLYINYNENMR